MNYSLDSRKDVDLLLINVMVLLNMMSFAKQIPSKIVIKMVLSLHNVLQTLIVMVANTGIQHLLLMTQRKNALVLKMME